MTRSFLQRLRSATADLHGALDASIAVACPQADAGQWHAYLVASWGWVVPFERALATSAWGRLPDADGRLRKEAWLRRDLLRLGLGAAQIDRLPLCPRVPPAGQLDAAGRWWGYLYVFEGSTLGGQVLAQMAAAALGWAPRWLAGYGGETARRWRQVCGALEAFATAADPAQREAAVAGACEAFAIVEAWLVESAVAGANPRSVRSRPAAARVVSV